MTGKATNEDANRRTYSRNTSEVAQSTYIAEIAFLVATLLLLYRGPELGPLKYADLAIVIASVLFVLYHNRSISLYLPVTVWFLVFLAAVTTSMVMASVPLSAGDVLEVPRYGLSFALFVMTFHYLSSNKGEWYRLRNVYLLAAIPSSIVGMVVAGLFVLGFNFEWMFPILTQPTEFRTSPFYFDPNFYSSALFVALFFGVDYILEKREQQYWGRLTIGVLAVILIFFGLLAAGSRTTVIALSASATCTGAVYVAARGLPTRWMWFASLGGVGIALIALMKPDLVDSILTFDVVRAHSATAGLSRRLELWTTALETWLNNPMFGLAPNSYYGPGVPFQNKSAHNMYIGILAQYGIFGFVAAFAVIMSVARKVSATLQDTVTTDSLFAMALFVGMLSFGLTLDMFESRQFWFTIGVVLAVAHGERPGITKDSNGGNGSRV